jgi:hypothetical protein
MKTKLMFLALVLLALASPIFAQGTGGAAPAGGVNWVAITSGFAMAIASGLCGLAQAKAAAAACRRDGTESRRRTLDPLRPAVESGADRIAGALHAWSLFS